MFEFFKKLIGIGSEETVAEILTPPAPKKVKAISVPIREGSQRTNVKKLKSNSNRPKAPPAPNSKK